MKLEPSVKERILKAFLDLAILRPLTDHPLTAYQINNLLVKKFGIIIAQNTIYSKLHAMEREEWVKRIRNRHGKAYSLTEQGQVIANNMTGIAEETQRFVKALLSC